MYRTRSLLYARRNLMRAFYGAVYIAGLPFQDGGITILSYHSLDTLGTPLSVAPRLFDAQMATIAGEGCTTLTMAQVARHLQTREPFPRRAVAITFDDGFASVMTVALPVLRRYDLCATVYVITGMIGHTTHWTDGAKRLPSLPILTRQEIDVLHANGIEIGAHSITHGFLTQYSDEQLRNELESPRVMLGAQLGTTVNAFAYPQGDYDARVVQAVRQAGYATATTVDQGRASLHDEPLTLPRLLVSNNTTAGVMRAFTVASAGPTYRLINVIVKRLMGKKQWPRRQPGEVDSTGSYPTGEASSD